MASLLLWLKVDVSSQPFQPETPRVFNLLHALLSNITHSRGVRGLEYSLEKVSDEYRIVVLGDSFAEGYTVEFEELFSEVLKQRLNEQGSRRVEVINLGVGGYSTDQELLQFQNEGIHYHPDLTIVMFHDNDVWYNAQKRYFAWRRGYKPLFRLKRNALHLTNVPVPVLAEEVSFQTKIQATFAHHSYLYRWITGLQTIQRCFPWPFHLA